MGAQQPEWHQAAMVIGAVCKQGQAAATACGRGGSIEAGAWSKLTPQINAAPRTFLRHASAPASTACKVDSAANHGGLPLPQSAAASWTMCGRYTHLLTWSQIVELYRLTLPDELKDLKPSYNVAPTHVMPIIRPAGNGRELIMAGWGLVPFWLKPDQLGKQPYSTINARDDRIQTAPTYREPFKKAPLLVPGDRGSL